jgi:hypothetical protein
VSSIHDTLGRPVHEGDTVGGTTSGRYQTTISGPVQKIGKGQVKVLVTNRPQHGGYRPANGDETWLSTDRLFLVHLAAERTFRGFADPDGRVWTLAPRTKETLFEAPMVPARYSALQLRNMYDAQLAPVWTEHTPEAVDQVVCDAEGHAIPHSPGCPDGPAPAPTEAETRAAAFAEAAARIWDLPQDYELDPGRGDARELLERLAAEAHQPEKYPLVLPWALLMDDDDLIAFLNDLAHVMQDARHMSTSAGPVHARRILAGLEKTCGTWRAVAEAQYGHNTAPGPDREDTMPGCPGAAIDHDETGVCAHD